MIEGKCKMCGKCCSTHIDLVQRPSDEMRQLLEWRGIVVKDLKPDELPNGWRRDIAFSMIIIPTKPCRHLDLKTKRCKIYENRPKICRDYPTNEFTLLPECGYTKK